MVSGDRAAVKGLLSWLDVLFFWGGGPLLSAANELGAVVIAALPNTDFATNPGNMIPVAYEHAIDLLVAPNDASAGWLAARGVPCAKIFVWPAMAPIGSRRLSSDPGHDPNTVANERAREGVLRELVGRVGGLVAAKQSVAAAA